LHLEPGVLRFGRRLPAEACGVAVRRDVKRGKLDGKIPARIRDVDVVEERGRAVVLPVVPENPYMLLPIAG
jgi:hypothetical protein